MPAERHHRQRDRRSGNPNYEARINEALESVASGEIISLRQAAMSQGVSCPLPLFFLLYSLLQIAKSTLDDRAKGRHTSW
jgi:hypothetical protein